MKRLEITPGCIAALCFLRLLVEPDVFQNFLAALAAHEAGHLIAIWAVGAKVTAIRFGAFDARITANLLSYQQEALCALAGPLASVLTCFALRKECPVYAAISLLLGLFNALPVFPLDAGRALRAALGLFMQLERAEAVCCVVSSAVCAAGLAAALVCARKLEMGALAPVVWCLLFLRLMRCAAEEGLVSRVMVRYNK